MLVIPGLIWPAQTFADLSHDLSLPALSRLFASARQETAPAATCDGVVARQLGIPQPLPAAALRRIELEQTADAGDWICLDPVHLGFVERRMMVGNPQELALTTDEAQALAHALAPFFAPFGELQVATPQAWHLRLAAQQLAPATTPLPELIGRRADLGLASLDKPWRQALNDAQIALHAHPVNLAREAAGKTVVNSLWPWGGGTLPEHPPRSPLPAALWTDAAELRGLARYLGIDAAPLPMRRPAQLPQSALVVLDTLAHPARRADAQAWRQELVRLEQDWFAPLLADLPRQLQIEFVGDSHGVVLQCSRTKLRLANMAFWRRPATSIRLSP
jgi:hypothetical protein